MKMEAEIGTSRTARKQEKVGGRKGPSLEPSKISWPGNTLISDFWSPEM